MENAERTNRKGMEQQGQEHLHTLLNANHRRVLSITLRRAELAARHLEDQIKRGTAQEHLALTRFVDAPGTQQQSALLHLATRLKQEIAAIASDCQLDEGEESFLRSIKAEFAILWSDLEDMRPEKLRNYGSVHPQAERFLTPRIERLIDLTLAISDVASGKLDSMLAWQQQLSGENGSNIPG
ncbi:MAG TPA: hypothetical protein VFA10_26950 [Ktedonobacteraceae bacterium]|nr:hypothetical protein [Ktedonobacteraceae bacterium]